MCGYNLTCAGTDWATAGRPRVNAGGTILVHAGLYKYNRHEYTNNAAVRLKPGSAAWDRGTPLAGITEGFIGKAPDLGALELGQTLPHYGPR
jgi:hypothetical protein